MHLSEGIRSEGFIANGSKQLRNGLCSILCFVIVEARKWRLDGRRAGRPSCIRHSRLRLIPWHCFVHS